MTRRELLAAGVAVTLVACTKGSGDGESAAPAGADGGAGADAGGPATITAADLPPFEPSADYPEGILSGDPAPDSVVLWTRPSPALVETGAELTAEVATDLAFADIVGTGSAAPDPAHEGASKFLVEGLEPGTAYVYRFRIGAATSPVGLTRTAPAPDAAVDELRMAVFSCQRFTHGYYTAHADLAEQAPDLVLCLGDYVYNTGKADGVEVAGRDDPVQDAHTLEEFRRKYEHYRTDPNLQAMHRVAPIVAVTDNHDGSARPDDDKYPGAMQAFFEKMPVRQDPDDDLRIHRRLTWGTLVDIWMLDLMRYYPDGDRGSGNTDGDLLMMDPEVSYLGAEQRAWLFDGFADTTSTWQIVGSQKQFSPLRTRAGGERDVPNAGAYINLDQWDGYQAERMAVLDAVEANGLTGVVAVSGDMHWFWAADVTRDFNDPASPAVLVDFLCGGISSSNADERIQGGAAGPQTQALMQLFGPANEAYVRFFDGDRHGYGLLTFRADGAEVEYRSPTTIREPEATTEVLARFRLDPSRAGIERLEPAQWPAPDAPG